MNLDTAGLPLAPTARYIGHDEQEPYVFSFGATATVLFLLLQAYHKSKYDEKTNFIITFSEFTLLVKYRSLQKLFQQGLDNGPYLLMVGAWVHLRCFDEYGVIEYLKKVICLFFLLFPDPGDDLGSKDCCPGLRSIGRCGGCIY